MFLIHPIILIFFFFPRNQQSEYLGTLWADVLAVSRGEVPSGEEISVVDSITVDWVMAPRNWGFNLKSNSTNYPDHGNHGDPPPTWKNSHGKAGNRTRDLVVSSRKLWTLDHEAGLTYAVDIT